MQWLEVSQLTGLGDVQGDEMQLSMSVLAGDAQGVEGLLLGEQLGRHQDADGDADVAVALQRGPQMLILLAFGDRSQRDRAMRGQIIERSRLQVSEGRRLS